MVESVDADGAIARTEDGRTVFWRLREEPEGASAVPDDLGVTLERAGALRDRSRFDESERLIASTLAGELAPQEARRARAALADLRFEWAHTLSARGEMERAVKPHREALEIARSGAVRDAPQPFSCVRPHERTPWVEADALDGLANAERARGHFSDALELYERALSAWKKVNDLTGRSAALTGMGLVRQDLGQFERAARLHREALALEARHPVARAVILNNLGNAQLGLRRLDPAAASFEEALGIYRRLQNQAGEGMVLNNLGVYWEARSDRARACGSYAHALAASRQADDQNGDTVTRRHLERIMDKGAADPAVQACRAALGE